MIKRILVLMLVTLGFAGPATRAWAGLFSGDNTVESVQEEISHLPANAAHSRSAFLYTELGRLLYREGRFEDAAQKYEKALTFDPSRSLRRHIYLYLGKSYEGVGRPEKVLEAYRQALTYDRKNWRRHRDLAQIYEQLMMYPEAVESYRNAIKYNSQSQTVYLSLGRTYRKMGLLTEAEAALNKAEVLGNDSAALYYELSLVNEGAGRYDEAAHRERQAVSSSSSVSDWGRLIYLAAMAGDKSLANEGLVQIRKRETLSDTISFYEELVDLLGRAPSARLNAKISDPTLRALLEEIRPLPVKS